MADDKMKRKSDLKIGTEVDELDVETRQEGELYNPNRTLDPEVPTAAVTGMAPMVGTMGDVSEAASGTYATDQNAAGSGVLSSVKEQAGAVLGQATDQAKEKAQQVVAQTKDVASNALGQAKDQVKTQLSQQKDRAVDGIAGAVTALQQAAQPFREANVPYVAEYAESFADQVNRLADYLRKNDVDALTADVERFARQNPALFIGGAFALGIGVARFLKSSGSNIQGFTDAERRTALVPVSQTPQAQMGGMSHGAGFMGDDVMRTDENIADLTGDRPVSAHSYVPGVGVVDEPTANV